MSSTAAPTSSLVLASVIPQLRNCGITRGFVSSRPKTTHEPRRRWRLRLSREKMPETWYRASRCCRVLGSPSAYLLLRAMDRGRATPTDLANKTGMTLQTVSRVLRDLRNLDMVRYLTKGIRKEYWIKDPSVLDILDDLEVFVDKLRQRRS